MDGVTGMRDSLRRRVLHCGADLFRKKSQNRTERTLVTSEVSEECGERL